jgi:hypothetical protein
MKNEKKKKMEERLFAEQNNTPSLQSSECAHINNSKRTRLYQLVHT